MLLPWLVSVVQKTGIAGSRKNHEMPVSGRMELIGTTRMNPNIAAIQVKSSILSLWLLIAARSSTLWSNTLVCPAKI